jgi:hypothetical protein
LHVIVFCAKILTKSRNKIPLKITIFIFIFRLSSSIPKILAHELIEICFWSRLIKLEINIR